MTPLHVIVSIVAVGAIVLVSGFVNYSQAEPADVVRFIDVSMIGEGEMVDDKTVIREGYYATITLDVEKLSAAPIEEIVVRSYLSNTENGDFLLIDNALLFAGLKMEHEDYLEYSDGVKTDPFQGTDKTGVMMISVSAINVPVKDLEDTVNVVLYADGIEMDRISFDVIVKNKGI